jgi:hypothetical protein
VMPRPLSPPFTPPGEQEEADFIFNPPGQSYFASPGHEYFDETMRMLENQ